MANLHVDVSSIVYALFMHVYIVVARKTIATTLACNFPPPLSQAIHSTSASRSIQLASCAIRHTFANLLFVPFAVRGTGRPCEQLARDFSHPVDRQGFSAHAVSW